MAPISTKHFLIYFDFRKVSDSLPTTPRNNGRIPFNNDSINETYDVGTLDTLATPDQNGGLQNPVEPPLLDSVRKDFKDRLDESSFLESNRTTPVDFEPVEREPHQAGIKLTRPDYYTKPALADIAGSDDKGECWVKGKVHNKVDFRLIIKIIFFKYVFTNKLQRF